eukprot:gene14338-15834_t
MSAPRGIILALGFEDFIIIPLILVLSILSIRICYRKWKGLWNGYTVCPNKDCIRCRGKVSLQGLRTRLRNYRLMINNIENGGIERVERSIECTESRNSRGCNQQSPTVFLMHDLNPAQPFHSVSSISSLSQLGEDATLKVLREELEMAIDKDFLWSRNNVASGSWKLFHFVNQGVIVEENCKICPRTAELILKIPEFMDKCSFGNALFSVLTPGTKIPSHTGSTNARLRCHVIIWPGDKCSITVGNQQKNYESGKLILFDDSYPHFVEFGGTNEELRAVLILDLWHPGVTQIERNAIQNIFTL